MATKPSDKFDPSTARLEDPSTAFDPTTAKLEPEGPARTIGGTIKDIGVTALKGAVAVPQSAVGLASLATGGLVGKGLESVGLRFNDAQKILDDQYSDAQKAAQQKVQQAEGFTGTAAAMLQNPSTIATAAGESIPSMFAGGAAARGLGLVGKFGPAVGAAMGEGIMGAGSAAEQIRGETADGLLTAQQAGLAGLTGVGTAALGAAGGRVAQRLGIGDVDTMIAKGSLGTAGETASKAGMAGQMARGALAEGVLEELPQSVNEQILQNLALDKDWSEGVDKAAAQGLIVGAAMGAGGGGLGAVGNRRAAAAEAEQVAEQQRAAGAAEQATTSAQGLTDQMDANQRAALSEAAATSAQANLDAVASEEVPETLPEQTAAPDGRALLDAQQAANRAEQSPDDEIYQSTGASAAQSFAPEPMPDPVVLADGSMALTGSDVAQARSMGLKPSQALGIDESAGPLSAAAAQAIDSGATTQLAVKSGNAPAVSEQSTTNSIANDAKQTGSGAGFQGETPATAARNQAPVATGVDAVAAAPVPAAGTGAGAVQAAGLSVAENATVVAPQETPGPALRLQNRDRSSAASVAQMNSIAAAPDYLRTGPSRTMDQGAPVVFGDTPASAVMGRAETVADGRGDRVQARYAVVEAGDVLTSHQADGTPIAGYEAGEPGKVRAVAGNGRAAGLTEGYRRGTAGTYRAELEQDAQSVGIDPAAVRAMRSPVLVRVMDQADVTPDIGDRSNTVGTQRLSPVEQAANDAARVDLGALQFTDDGRPLASSINGFVQAMPESERGDMLNPDGTPTRQAVDRLMAATFKQAYDSDALVQLYAQATDPEARAVMSALADAAGAMSALKGQGEFDVRAAVADAAGMAVNAARQGLKLADVLQNADLDMNPEAFVVAEFMAQNIRSSKRMADGLRNMAQLALEQVQIARDNETQAGMFGETPTVPRQQILESLNRDIQKQPSADAGRAGTAARVAERQGADATAAESGRADRAERGGQREAGQAEDRLSERPANWRTNYLRAAGVARGLGIDPKQHKTTAALVAAIEAADFAQNQAPAQASQAQTATETVADSGEFALTSPTPDDIIASQEALEREQADRAAADAQAERRARADAERDSFTLTGSDRAADVAEARGQAPMFSRSGDTRNLVTLHNLTAENLMRADEMGGLPVPSLGVTKVDSPFSGFGNITLIGSRDMVDPASGTPVFDRDAYTARFPDMNYKRPKTKAADALYEKMKPARELGGDGQGFIGELWEALKNDRNPNPKKVAYLFERDRAPRMLYARDVLGRDIKVPMREQVRRYPFTADKQLLAFVRKNELAIWGRGDTTNEQNTQALADLTREVDAAISRWAESNPKANIGGLANQYRKHLFDDGGITARALGTVMQDAKTVGVKVVDETKLEAAIRKVVPQDDAGYQAWVKAMVDPLFDPPTITLRGREVEPTLDSLVAAMSIGRTQGAEKTMTSGTGKTAAMLGKQFKSIAEIQAARDQVVSEAAENEAKKSNEQVLSEYQNAVLPFFKYKNWKGEVDTWAGLDAAMEALADAGKRGSTDAAIRQALSKQDFTGVDQATVNLARQSIDALRNTPTNYFEAKPQRAVGLDEFRGAVVPRGTDPRALAVLAKHGIEVVEHGKGEGAREKAIAKLSKKLDKTNKDVLFSFAGQGAITADRHALAAAEQRIAAGEDAEAVRQDTGWSKGVDGRWKFEINDADAALVLAPEEFHAFADAGGSVNLGDVLDHPALFAAYPQLANLPVGTKAGRGASYSTAKGQILMGRDVPAGQFRSVLMHEVQHGIQTIEGFATGGAVAQYRGDHQAQRDQYRREAGEVEARNVQTRLDMTDAERQAFAPDMTADVEPGAQVVSFNGKVATNSPAMANGQAMDAFAERLVAGVQSSVDKIKAKWKNAPEVVVVHSMQDEKVPERVREADAAQRSQGAEGEPEGFFYQGKVYVVASQMHSRADVARVLMHETLGHFGLRGVFGKTLDAQLRQLMLGRQKDVIARARNYGLVGEGVNVDTATDVEVWASMSERQRMEAAEEVLAFLAQTEPQLSVVQRAIAAIRTWLRENVPALAGIEMTDAEVINNYILPARNWVERGEGQASGGRAAFSRANDQTKTEAFKKWFGDSKAVDENGSPLVVYHGAPSTFNKFKPSRQGTFGPGMYFANSRESAENYLHGDTGERVVDAYLSLQNPWMPKAEFDSAGAVAEDVDSPIIEAVLSLPKGRAIIDAARKSGSLTEFAHFGDELQRHLKSLGYDGIMAEYGDGSMEIVAFRPEQIKSAFGNSGAFDPGNPDIRFSRAAPTQIGWNSPEASRFDDKVYLLQDKHIDTKRVIEALDESGRQVSEDLNVYLQEELFHGRVAKRVGDFQTGEMASVMEAIKRAGMDIGDVEEYLHARHAKEANALIAQREPSMADGGSGMTNAAADAYMAVLPAADRQKLEGIAAMVDGVIANTRQLYVDYGLESKDTVDGWGTMFKHYVPLQREDKEGGMGIGQGFSVQGKEVKGRTGSTRKVVDILANIALQREMVLVTGEKNRVAAALVGLVQANPNDKFWRIGPPEATRVYDPKTDSVVDRVDPNYKKRKNVVVAKIPRADGSVQEMAVTFEESDPRALRMAGALKNLDAARIEGLLGVSAKITRYFAAVNTQWNPVFGAVNLVRDVQGAMVNLQSTPLAGLQGKIAKDTAAALAGIYSDLRRARKGGKAGSKWAQLFDQFQEDGGQTGYRDQFANSADRAEALKRQLNPAAWAETKAGRIITAGGTLTVPMEQARKVLGPVFNWLTDYNDAMENGVRLAAYKAALDKGLSRQQAASIAKNLTVNFNRKGQVAQQAGALYAFFNAAMQGTARIAEALFTMDKGDIKSLRLSKTGKQVVYGGMLLGTLQAMALAGAGFDDEDPPDFARERNLIIPTGGKSYVSIPMPLGLHVIPGIGRHAMEFALGGFKDPAKRAISVAGMFADAFNPIGNAGMSMQTLAPTVLDPLVALTENKDFTGKPIARVSSNKDMPGHLQGKDTSTYIGKLLSESINFASGGNHYRAGVFSPTPDQIDYLFAQVTGGVGREYAKVEQTATSLAQGEELPPYKVPFFGRFYGNAKSQASQGAAFYAATGRLNALETEAKNMRKDGNWQGALQLIQSRPDARLIDQANETERRVQELRREKRALVAKGASRDVVRAKEEQITQVMQRFNESFAKVQAS